VGNTIVTSGVGVAVGVAVGVGDGLDVGDGSTVTTGIVGTGIDINVAVIGIGGANCTVIVGVLLTPATTVFVPTASAREVASLGCVGDDESDNGFSVAWFVCNACIHPASATMTIIHSATRYARATTIRSNLEQILLISRREIV